VAVGVHVGVDEGFCVSKKDIIACLSIEKSINIIAIT
jgi:hypothetical protein